MISVRRGTSLPLVCVASVNAATTARATAKDVSVAAPLIVVAIGESHVGAGEAIRAVLIAAFARTAAARTPARFLRREARRSDCTVSVHTYVSTCVYVRVYVCVCTCVCMYVCCVQPWIRSCCCDNIYIYIYIYIYIAVQIIRYVGQKLRPVC